MRPIRLTHLSLWLLGALIGASPVVQAAPDAPEPSLFPSANERFGFGVVSDISRFDVGQLHAGWYVNWGATSQVKNPAGLEYVQIIRVCDSQYRSCSTPYSPYGEALANAVRNNPGLLWLIGNEPDRIYVQDSARPIVYAQLYHELYHRIKSLDPTARVAIGGMVQPTELRMRWLDMVWSEYQRLYGQAMPVDVWNVHNFVLREVKPGLSLERLLQCSRGGRELGAWGAGIPPGFENQVDCGLWIEIDELDRMDLFQEQIVRFRRWMRDHGQRDKELIISEYAILFPEELGYGFERVRNYMVATFDYFLNARDSNLGVPADGNRLVQRWAWYSLDDTSFGWGRTWGALFDPDTNQITPMGQAFAAYTAPLITPYVDLRPIGLAYWVEKSPLWEGEPADIRLQGIIANWGNVAAGSSLARFWSQYRTYLPSLSKAQATVGASSVGSGQAEEARRLTGDGGQGASGSRALGMLIAEQVVPSVSSRYQGQATVSALWTKAGADGMTVVLEADALNQLAESNEANNMLAVTIQLALDLAVTAPETDHPARMASAETPVAIPLRARVRSLGGLGANTPLTVEFWDGDPNAGGRLIGTDRLEPGSDGLATVVWPDRYPGRYRVYVRLVGPAGDINPDNNLATGDILVASDRTFLPLVGTR